MNDFGPEYSKIQTVWKRDDRGVVIVTSRMSGTPPARPSNPALGAVRP